METFIRKRILLNYFSALRLIPEPWIEVIFMCFYKLHNLWLKRVLIPAPRDPLALHIISRPNHKNLLPVTASNPTPDITCVRSLVIADKIIFPLSINAKPIFTVSCEIAKLKNLNSNVENGMYNCPFLPLPDAMNLYYIR